MFKINSKLVVSFLLGNIVAMPCISFADDNIENITKSGPEITLTSTTTLDKADADILERAREREIAYDNSTSESSKALKIGPVDNYNFHGQVTYIFQKKPSFNAPYDGTQSLTHSLEKGYSTTFTGFLGVRPWKGSELY